MGAFAPTGAARSRVPVLRRSGLQIAAVYVDLRLLSPSLGPPVFQQNRSSCVGRNMASDFHKFHPFLVGACLEFDGPLFDDLVADGLFVQTALNPLVGGALGALYG